MSRRHISKLRAAAACVLSLLWLAVPSAAQEAAETVFEGARALYLAVEDEPEDNRLEAYRTVRSLLDLVLSEYPESDTARRIVMQDSPEDFDIAALDAALAEAEAEEVEATTEPPQAAISPETGTRSEREIIADVQSELNRLGCDAGGVDGVPGRRTLAAVERYSDITGLALTAENFVSELVLEIMRATNEPVCTARWIARNAPEKLAGNWGFRRDCKTLFIGVRSRGSFTLEMTEFGVFRGTARGSRDRRGPIFARVDGDVLRARINWSGEPLRMSLFTSRRSMGLSGKDSNDCDIVAWKN